MTEVSMIRRIQLAIGLPLLTRELIELAARRRTFVLRFVYAALFLGLIVLMTPHLFATGAGFQHLGMGHGLFSQMMIWELTGIYLVMPLITCGAIAQEKERDTLQLLLLTDLTPNSIVIQKLLSRSLVMISLLLVATPLTAYAYSLGGVPSEQVLMSFLVLCMTTLVVGAWTLMWSAWCSTTAGALIASLALGVPFSGMMSIGVVPAISPSIVATATGAPAAIGPGIAVMCVQAVLLFAFLQMAASAMVKKAGEPPRNLVLEFFRGLDRFFTELNDSTTGGIVLIKDRRTLPGAEPVTWRESNRKSLGQFRYLMRVMLIIELPTVLLLIIQAGNASSFRQSAGVFAGLTYVQWVVVSGIISVKAASLIAGERGRQTLDVLLTTPLSGTDLLRQFLKGMHRMFLSIPFLTTEAFRIYLSDMYLNTMIQSLGSLVVLVIYFLLCAWIAMFIGLRLRNQLRAIIVSTLLIQSWILLPGILLPGSLYSSDNPSSIFISPAVIVVAMSREIIPLQPLLLNCAWYGLLLYGLRWWCYRHANAWLGRTDATHQKSRLIVEDVSVGGVSEIQPRW